MSIETQITRASDTAHDASDKPSQPGHLQNALPDMADASNKGKASAAAPLPEAFGKFSLSDSASASGKTDDKPTVTLLNEPQGTIIDKRWSNGDEEFDHADGTKVTFKPDHKGGEVSVITRPDGTESTYYARPDGKGGAIVENKNDADPGDNYTAYFNKDGSLKVDWKDGRHMERHTDENGLVHTTMTGKDAQDNFTATESFTPRERQVKFADGSSYSEKNGGDAEVHGRYGGLGIMDGIFESAGDYHLATDWRLIGAFWMGESKPAHDVMSGGLN